MIETVAGTEFTMPSLATNVKLSAPNSSALGVYVTEAEVASMGVIAPSVPRVGGVWIAKLSGSPSPSLAVNTMVCAGASSR